MKNQIVPNKAYESARIVDALVSGYSTSYDDSQRLNYDNVIAQLVLDAQSALRGYDMNQMPKTLHLCIIQSMIDGDYHVGWLTTDDVMHAPNYVEVLGDVDVITYAGLIDNVESYAYTVDSADVRDLILREWQY